MHTIFSDLPSPEKVLELELHELADYVLKYLKSLSHQERAPLSREMVVSQPYNAFDIPDAYRDLSKADWERISEALIEAWNLLEQKRFISPKPETSIGYLFITRLGQQQDSVQIEHVSDLYGIHPAIHEKCYELYKNKTYAEAVEKSFKVVRDRLRELTTHETGQNAFGKGKLYMRGASAPNVDRDFNEAVKFLTMAIGNFRNEKSHTSDAKIEDPIRAYQYLMLSSLAMSLLEDTEIRP